MTIHFFTGVTLTLYELLLIFFTYAFLGWCCEVAFAAMKTGTFVNRGFLNSPLCPIYGFGMVIVVVFLTPLTDNSLLLFLGSTVLTSALEFFVGWLLDKLFHTKWWDYSNQKFNLKGYICLQFSVIWGLACVMIMQIFHPVIMDVLYRIPYKVGVVILVILCCLVIVDLIATVTAVRGLQKRLHAITKLAEEIHELSDDLGENIAEVVQAVKLRTDESKTVYDELSAMIETHLAEEKALAQLHRQQEQELRDQLLGENKEARTARKQLRQEEFRAKLEEKKRSQNRIIKAFPSMRVGSDQDALDKLRSAVEKKSKNKK